MKIYILLAIILLLVAFGFYLHKPPIDLDTLKAQYTDEHSHFIELIGLDVHYKKKGQGMPVILIHGTSASLNTWEPWEEELSKKYTTYSIDMQGGGLTTPPSDNIYSIASYLNLIDAFVLELGIDSFYLVGNSLGGHTAWAYAANSPLADRVKKLVLVDPSGFIDPKREKPMVFQMAQFDFLLNNSEKLNTSPFVEKSLKEVFYNEELVTPERIKQYDDLGLRPGNREAFFLKVRQMEYGTTEDLEKISCPTLILWGENDEWIPLSLAEIFRTYIPNNELIVYPECGHIPMEEKAEESAEDVMEFFLRERTPQTKALL
jgi:pimeloyl-ACP methyl ester carboxylesterase